MSLSLSRGPSVAESYQGFSSAPLGRAAGDNARRRLDVTLVLMIGMVAVGAAVGVGLGLNAPFSPPVTTPATARPLMTGFAETPSPGDSYPALASEFPAASMGAPPPRAPVAPSSREGSPIRVSYERAARAVGEPSPRLSGAAATAQNRARNPVRAEPGKPRSESPPQVRSTGWPYVSGHTNDPPY